MAPRPNPNAASMLASFRSGQTGGFPGAAMGANPAATSPLITAWNRGSDLGAASNWGQVYRAAIGLPRTYDTYISGQFLAGMPIYPVPIDIPEEPSGRPRPRRFQYPINFNLPLGMPGTEGVKLAAFQTLRDLAEPQSILRSCVELGKGDLVALDWDIVPTPDAARAMQGNPKKRVDFEKRKAEVMQFFENPDPDNYDGFDEWLNAVLEDSFVLDAVALYVQPAGGKGNGPCGSDVGALAVVDGSTVKPLLAIDGSRPRPPEVFAQQYLWGVPRVDLMDLINLGPDATLEEIKDLNPVLEELTVQVDEWSADQLIYFKTNPRSWCPYGFGPVEQCILPATIMQARMTWQWEFYRSGSLPCHDDQTEVLTENGWKLFAKLDLDDQVATRAVDGSFEWQVPTAHHASDYDGDLLHFKNQGLDIMVTPDHRMLVRRPETQRKRMAWASPKAARPEEYDWHFRKASTFCSEPAMHPHFEMPTVPTNWAGVDPGPEFLLPKRTPQGRDVRMPMDAWVRFLGLYLAEGWVRVTPYKNGAACRGDVSIAAARHNPRFPEVEAVLRATGLTWRYREGRTSTKAKGTCGEWTTSNRALAEYLVSYGRHSWEKRIPEGVKEYPPALLRPFVDGAMLGDGEFTPIGARRYASTSRALAEDMQEIWMKLGWDTFLGLYEQGPRSGARRPIYILQQRVGRKGDSRGPQAGARILPRPTSVPYSGRVYCVSVGNGVVLTRRNGKLAWTGNSVFMDPGESIANAEEARQVQEAINMLGGDLAGMHQVIVTPPGAKIMPQKSVDLTSQFDEWMTALIVMPFGYSISDLGITPKVASMQSPQASRTAAVTATDRSVRRAVIPRAKKMKSKILDRIIQGKLGQQDMQWSWGIQEQGESKNDLVTQWTGVVKDSIAAIDEARVALELDPYGEEWSSVPLVFTATGAMTLEQAITQALMAPVADPNAITVGSKPVPGPGGKPPPGKPGQPALPPGKKPPGGPAGSTKPPAKKPTGSPTTAHAGSQAVESAPPEEHVSSEQKKAVQAELDQLHRFLKRGRPIAKFVPKTLSTSAMAAGVRTSGPVGAVVAAVGKAQNRADHKQQALAQPRKQVVEAITAAGTALAAGTHTKTGFVDAGTQALTDGFTAAYTAGAGIALDTAPDDVNLTPIDDWTDQASARANNQQSFLAGLADDIAAGLSVAALAQRAGLYGDSLSRGYEDGYATQGTTSDDDSAQAVIRWNLGDSERPCGLCSDRDSTDFAPEDLPGYPGDGGFGEICEGGPQCACTIELIYGDATLAETEPSVAREQSTAPAADLGMAGKPAVVKMPDETGHNSDGYSPDMTADQFRTHLTDIHGLPHDFSNHGVYMAAGMMPDYGRDDSQYNPTLVRDLLDLYHKGQHNQNGECGAHEPSYKDFSLSSPLSTGFAPFDLEGGVRGVYPDPLAGREVVERCADEQTARRMLDALYDPSEYEVVGSAICVKSFDPLFDLDLTSRARDTDDGATASKRFLTVAEAKAGTLIDNQPTSSADAVADVTVRFAGLAVRAEDTGRVLLIQRAIDDEDGRSDPAAGTWELPGGHLEDGELPFAGAQREWAEEVGHPAPRGRVVATRVSPNGYQLFVLAVPREADVQINQGPSRTVVNPDGDRFESCAFFDITDLYGMPSLRQELAQDFPNAELTAPIVKTAEVDKKVSKASVGYRHATGSRKCATCSMFRMNPPDFESGACTLVEGLIQADDTCDRWEPAESSKSVETDTESVAPPRMMGTSIDEKEVFDYLAEHYESDTLGWVSRCLWTSDHVLLDDIDYENRPGGIDQSKVDDMADKLKDGWTPHPVVLVAPGVDSKLIPADGYHRLGGLAEAGFDVTEAWVGSPKPGNTGWKADVRAMQITGVENHPGNQ